MGKREEGSKGMEVGGHGTGKDIYCIFRRSAEFDKMAKLFYFRENNI